MLLLSRRTNERIMAGNITITVVRINGGKVRLGISAPKTTVVHRREVLKKISEGQEGGRP